MAYEKTEWIDNITELNADNMNHIEDGIYQNAQDIADLKEEVESGSASFKGNWANWEAVPTNPEDYPISEGVHAPNHNDYIDINNASDYPVAEGEEALHGSWRFIYIGTWAEHGKNGWHPGHALEQPLTPAEQAALDSGITAEKVAQIDTNTNTINEINVIASENHRGFVYEWIDEEGFHIWTQNPNEVEYSVENGVYNITTMNFTVENGIYNIGGNE